MPDSEGKAKLVDLEGLTTFWKNLKSRLGLGINPTTNNTGSIGTSSLKWKDVYATTLHGNLSGDVTGNVSGSSGSCTGNAVTATTASKLGTDAGSSNQPIYFSNGVPVAITGAINNNVNSMGWTEKDVSQAIEGIIKINGIDYTIYDTFLHEQGVHINSTEENPKDLNDYITPGVYYSANTEETSTILNTPAQAGFRLIVLAGYSGISSRGFQIITTSTSHIYYRQMGASNTAPLAWHTIGGKIKATSISVPTTAWVSNSTYTDFPFRASVAVTGMTSSYYPEVTFSPTDAISGILCPVATSYNGGVYIYASEVPEAAVTILTVIGLL